jgi:hypothetical protein
MAMALRAIVKWPFLARRLTARDFTCPHMRAAFECLVSTGNVFACDPGIVATHELFDTDDARVADVEDLRTYARMGRRKAALLKAAVACEACDEEAYDRAMAELASA